MNPDLDFAVDLARQSGALLLEYFHQADTTGLDTRFKADRSIVTEADLAIDHLIAQAVREKYPQDLLLSEELQTSLPAFEENISSPIGVWIIDPLDGTTNFSLGLHFWGVLITRLQAGVPQLTVQYFPVVNELYTAVAGLGACLNGQPIHIQAPQQDRPRAFFSCCSRTFRRYRVDIPYKVRILGSAAYTLCSVARGIALLGFESTAKIWDIAGGWLLVQEAGGVVGQLDDSQPFPLRHGIDYARRSYPTIAAATPDLFAQARAGIHPKSS